VLRTLRRKVLPVAPPGASYSRRSGPADSQEPPLNQSAVLTPVEARNHTGQPPPWATSTQLPVRRDAGNIDRK